MKLTLEQIQEMSEGDLQVLRRMAEEELEVRRTKLPARMTVDMGGCFEEAAHPRCSQCRAFVPTGRERCTVCGNTVGRLLPPADRTGDILDPAGMTIATDKRAEMGHGKAVAKIELQSAYPAELVGPAIHWTPPSAEEMDRMMKALEDLHGGPGRPSVQIHPLPFAVSHAFTAQVEKVTMQPPDHAPQPGARVVLDGEYVTTGVQKMGDFTVQTLERVESEPAPTTPQKYQPNPDGTCGCPDDVVLRGPGCQCGGR